MDRWQNYVDGAQEEVKNQDEATKEKGLSKAPDYSATALWKQPLAGHCTPRGKRHLMKEDGHSARRGEALRSRGARLGEADPASLAEPRHRVDTLQDSHSIPGEGHDATAANVKSRWAMKAASSRVPCRARKRQPKISPCSSIESLPDSLQKSSDLDTDAISDSCSVGTPESHASPFTGAGQDHISKLTLQIVGKRLCRRLE